MELTTHDRQVLTSLLHAELCVWIGREILAEERLDANSGRIRKRAQAVTNRAPERIAHLERLIEILKPF